MARPIGEMEVGSVSDVLSKKSGFAVLQAWGEKPQSDLLSEIDITTVNARRVVTWMDAKQSQSEIISVVE